MALRRISDFLYSPELFFVEPVTMQSEPLRVLKPFCILDCRGVQQCTLLCSPEARHLCHCLFFFFHFETIWVFCLFFFVVFLKSLFRVQFCSQNFPDGDGFQVPTYPHHIRTSVSLLAQ